MWQQHAYLTEHLHHSTPAAHLYIKQETGNLGNVLRRGPCKCPIEGGQEAERLEGLNLQTHSSTSAPLTSLGLLRLCSRCKRREMQRPKSWV